MAHIGRGVSVSGHDYTLAQTSQQKQQKLLPAMK